MNNQNHATIFYIPSAIDTLNMHINKQFAQQTKLFKAIPFKLFIFNWTKTNKNQSYELSSSN